MCLCNKDDLVEYAMYFKNTIHDIFYSIKYKTYLIHEEDESILKSKVIVTTDPALWYCRFLIPVELIDIGEDFGKFGNEYRYEVFIDSIDDVIMRRNCKSLEEAKFIYKKIPPFVSNDFLRNELGFELE